MKKVLTIAGSDSSGGAGIQADLKTFCAHNVYGMSVITAVTAQNTMGVSHIETLSSLSVKKQIEAVAEDIGIDALKIGMLANKEIILTVAEMIKYYGFKNIVLDPVMISTTGYDLLEYDAKKALIETLMPLAHIITPNLHEASSILSIKKIDNKEMMEEAAQSFKSLTKAAVLLKGGHLIDEASDLLVYDENIRWYRGEIIKTKNTHGTGCTLSSAIAANLAKGLLIEEAVLKAKEYITGAIKNSLDIGKGSGPTNHLYKWRNMKEEVSNALHQLRDNNPLVHHITNSVTINDCANITLAIGGSPVMADDENEVTQMTSLASSLVLNIGTLNSRTVDSMILAGKKANALNIPVILDPVGAGATSYRTMWAKKLFEELDIAVIRGNASEIMAMAGEKGNTKGVDSSNAAYAAIAYARKLILIKPCIVAITGEIDIVISSSREMKLSNGTKLMKQVTGTGCMATSLIGAFCGSKIDAFTSTVSALTILGIAGELSECSLKNNEGIGTFRTRLFDFVHTMDANKINLYMEVKEDVSI